MKNLRQFEAVPFLDPVKMNVLVDGEDFIWMDDHYWPVRSASNKYGRQVPSVTTQGTKYGNPTRHFGAQRPNKPEADSRLRWHCGVDLGGHHLDVVVACQAGKVVSIHKYHMGTHGMLIAAPLHGPVIHYGEIEKDSWAEFGINDTSTVKAGQPIARLGRMNKSSMLHFEMYRSTTTTKASWYQTESAPERLRDPTKYLLFLAKWGL